MFRFLKSARVAPKSGRKGRKRRVNLGVERLDQRLVPSATPNIAHAQFTLDVGGHTGQLSVFDENTSSGTFQGIFADGTTGAVGVAFGHVSSTVTLPSGKQIADLSFTAFNEPSGATDSFDGLLIGTGTNGGFYGSDQLSGTVQETVLHTVPGAAWVTGGSFNVSGNDLGPILNLNNAHFSMDGGGQLVVQSENTGTGDFTGQYTNREGTLIPVSGHVSRATTMQNGRPVADISFAGELNEIVDRAYIDFNGKVNGTGTDGKAFGNDQLTGSGTEDTLPGPGLVDPTQDVPAGWFTQLPSPSGHALELPPGPAAGGGDTQLPSPSGHSVNSGNDLGPIVNLSGAKMHMWMDEQDGMARLSLSGPFIIPAGHFADLNVVSENADGTFTGTYHDSSIGQTVVVHGQVGRATDLQNGQPVAPVSFSGQVVDSQGQIQDLSFSGQNVGPGTNGQHYGTDTLTGYWWDHDPNGHTADHVIGHDYAPPILR